MGPIKFIGRTLTIITILMVFLGIKIYFDVMDDKDDFQTLIQQSPEMTQEELETNMQICDEKEYFNPLCQLQEINYKYNNGEELIKMDCNLIKYSGVPYYLYPFNEKVKNYFEEIRTDCEFGINSAGEIIELT
ncbi:hypothetical protein HOG16_03370 [Candidatus Woesearchaeota archaeon]|jgi:hypothetical protein|nr:hypothetical protein [Candidatus Woesearchaeota archaeon]MBT4321565.1 hypothetical protein [Candidatus Woesearchaeota archaeon]MBT4631124.1 hypothetical protein [Candidatus Woesearchaeota archaeon]